MGVFWSLSQLSVGERQGSTWTGTSPSQGSKPSNDKQKVERVFGFPQRHIQKSSHTCWSQNQIWSLIEINQGSHNSEDDTLMFLFVRTVKAVQPKLEKVSCVSTTKCTFLRHYGHQKNKHLYEAEAHHSFLAALLSVFILKLY